MLLIESLADVKYDPYLSTAVCFNVQPHNISVSGGVEAIVAVLNCINVFNTGVGATVVLSFSITKFLYGSCPRKENGRFL